MKILQMCTRFPPAPGGVETDVYRISKALVKKGYDIQVFTSDLYTETPFRKLDSNSCEDKNVNVTRFKAYTPGGEMHYVFEPGMITAALKYDADIIHAHSYGYFQTNIAYLTKLMKGRKFVFSTHYHPEWSMWGGAKRKILRKYYDKLFARRIIGAADAIVVESMLEAEYLRSLTALELPNIVTIPPGIDFQRFDPLANPSIFRKKYSIDERIVLFVGRLASNKGLDTLLEAIPKVLKEFIDVKFVIIGEDVGMRKYLEKKAKFLGIEDRVLFTGLVKADNLLLSAYSAADLFVLPSEYEAFGIVLLEAMASGRACIGTKVGGIPEAILHGKTGLLVEYGNKDILAERINQLLLDDYTRKRMGETGRERVKTHFTWDIVANQFDKLYGNVFDGLVGKDIGNSQERDGS